MGHGVFSLTKDPNLLDDLQARLLGGQRAAADPDLVGGRLDGALDIDVVEVELVEAQREFDVLRSRPGASVTRANPFSSRTGCSTLALVLRMYICTTSVPATLPGVAARRRRP